MKQKLKDFLSENYKDSSVVLIMLLVMMIILATLQFILSIDFNILMIVLLLISWGFMLLMKDALPSSMKREDRESKQNFYINIVVWITIFAFFMFTDYMFCLIDRGNALLKMFSLAMLILLSILGLYLSISKTNNLKTSLMQFDIYTGSPSDDEVEPGAVILGKEMDPETGKVSNKNVILHYVDRFVHMIIYGPTGSGKTSLLLSPMAYQDLQNKDIGVIVLEPKGDFAEKVYAWGRYLGREKVTYFNPTLPKCPYFNPLMCKEGNEAEMIENLVTAFAAVDTTASSYFRDNNEMLLRNCLWTVKRLYGNDATFNNVLELMDNINGKGEQMMKELHNLKYNDPLIMADNSKIYNYFKNDYLPGIKGGKNATKTYTDSSSIRTQIKKLVSNPILARVLIPPKSSTLKEGEYIDFDRVLENGEVLCLCSAQGVLRDMGTYLGYFLILTLQSSVFKRPGNEKTRRGCMLYIDEFQKYSNGSMADLLTQGRSYRVACIFATQNRSLINNGGESGRQFLENVSTNCRNLVVFPGASSDDAKYFANEFGTHIVEKEKTSYSNRAYVPKFVGFDSARVTTSVDSKEEPVYSPSTIIYQPFHRVFVRLISKNSVSRAACVYTDFVDRSVDENSQKYLDEVKAPDNSRKPQKVATEVLTDLFEEDEEQENSQRNDNEVLWDLFDEEDEDAQDSASQASEKSKDGQRDENNNNDDSDSDHDDVVEQDNDYNDFEEEEELQEL